MAEPVRHRQAQGAATDMFDLPPPRHTSTLPVELVPTRIANGGYGGKSRQASTTRVRAVLGRAEALDRPLSPRAAG
jgi:hypothetical protein